MTATGNAVWSSRFAFIMASVGFAVGLGNIWRFPYVTGENGGSAFVVIYLLCAVAIGIPDPIRTEYIKVFIKLARGQNGSPQLEKNIQDFVKTRLSPHEYPRAVEFISELPLTATGKVKRKELRDAEILKLRAKNST